MTTARRRLSALVLATLLAGACGGDPAVTPAPTAAGPSVAPSATPSLADERPFAPTAWPVTGNACETPGYTGLLGRVEAVTARTVRFRLCRPDGAFPARLADPVAGIVDAAAVDAIAADPSVARLVAGAGLYRVDAWTAGDNVRLVRVDGAGTAAAAPSGGVATAPAAEPSSASPSGSSGTEASPPPTIVIRWNTLSGDRTAALRQAEVDGIDAPDRTDSALIDTIPELVLVPRPGLATAYLGFGTGKRFSTPVRRAFAEGLDHDALARDAFPPGSVGATHLSPCVVPAGCAGEDWYAFNGPDGVAVLAAAGFDRTVAIPLHVPDAPVPGLPDPMTVADTVRDQLAASLGVNLVVDVMPATDLAAAIAAGDLSGLYLGGVASTLADPSGFLGPLFGTTASGTASSRGKGIRAALLDAAAATDPATREGAFASASDALRATAALVPLVHPGSNAAYRADVSGVAISPAGVDPLDAFVPGDRRQLVVMGAAEPGGVWCAGQTSPDAMRLCALVTPGLYAFAGATLDPVPALASRCTPDSGATVWTCRLRADETFSDGRRVDAGDIVASFQAQADPTSPLRAAMPAGSFAGFDALFGTLADGGTAP